MTKYRVGPDVDDVPRSAGAIVPTPAHPVADPRRTLLGGLASVIDSARQLATNIGARPYRVFSITVRWTGGAKGRGEPVVASEREFLPTPKADIDSLKSAMNSGGVSDAGFVRVTEISPRYTEAEVHSLCHIHPLPPDREGWIEVTMDQRDGSQAQRRRFQVGGAPFFRAEQMEWVLDLRSEQQNRTSAGMPRDVVVVLAR